MQHRYQPELKYAVKDVDLLIAYIAKNGKQVPKELLEKLVNAKQRGNVENWTPEQETEFWLAFTEVTTLIQPVTIASLKMFAGNLDYAFSLSKESKKGKLQKTIVRYGVVAFVVIFLIIILQTYHFVGQDVLSKSRELFDQRNAVREQIKVKKVVSEKLKQRIGVDQQDDQLLEYDETFQLLLSKEEVLDQEFDANRILLSKWNMVWMLGMPIKPEFSRYDKFRYESEKGRLQLKRDGLKKELQGIGENQRQKIKESISVAEGEIDNIDKKMLLHKSRDVFFRSGLSAMYILNLLHLYILPTLYGCLGAFSLVLRTICRSIKDETFSVSFSLDYNMRIILGSVTGMSVGLFFGNNSMLIDDNISLMLVAFVVGYNVEVLFSLVDSVANRIKLKQYGVESGRPRGVDKPA